MVQGFFTYQILSVFLIVFTRVPAEWVDMTFDFDHQTVYWPDTKQFTRTLVQKGMAKNGTFYSPYDISANEHGGTHSDAPIHSHKNGTPIDRVPLKSLIGHAVVVNISEKAANNRSYRLSVKDLEDWERVNGKIPNGAIVLLYSGWQKYWPNARLFLGMGFGEGSGVGTLHFPGFHPKAAEWIVKSGKVKAVGTDTISLDYGRSTVFTSHVIFSEANIPGLEVVANLDKLPARGAMIYAAPMKIKDGSGGPTRIFAEIKKGGKKDQCTSGRTKITWLDMTHSLVNGTVYWPGTTAFSLRFYKAPIKIDLKVYDYSTSENSGTHIASPIHFSKGKWSTDEIPLDNLIGPAVKIDISDKVFNNANYQLQPSDIEEWEKQHGNISKRVIVLVYTGWGKFWPDKLKYYGMKPGENDSLTFPGIHPDAATWMVKRKVKAVGADTPSLDYGPSKYFATHRILSEANIPGFQSVANLEELPTTNATVFATPMKIKGGSGGPLRIFAKLGEKCSTSGARHRAVIGHMMFFIIEVLLSFYITFQ